MNELIKTINDIIIKLREAGLLRLILGALTFLGTLGVLQFLHRLIAKRMNIRPIKGSILSMIFMMATFAFFLTVGDSSLIKIVNSIIIFFVILMSIKIIDYAFVEEFLIKKKQFKITRLPRDIIKGLLFTTLFLIMLNSFFGISMQGIGITAAVATGVLGFALQDTLSNVIAGFSISVEKPFKVGDWVRVKDIEGRVEQMSWRTTRIKTFNDDYIIIPNYNISRTEVFNFCIPTKAHSRELKLGVDYSHPPELVKKTIIDSVKSTHGVMEHPAPVVRLINYGDFSINYLIKFWINDFSKYPQVESDFFSMLWYNFKRNNITIPFPIRDVRIDNQKKTEIQSAPPMEVSYKELRSLPIFQKLSAKTVRMTVPLMIRALYGAGETVFSFGDKGDFLYVIARGSVNVIKKNTSSRNQSLVLDEGEIFGEISMVSGGSRTATISTIEECEFFSIHRNDFIRLLEKNPDLTKKVGQIIANRKKHSEEINTNVEASGAKEDKKVKTSSVLDNLKKYLGFS